MSSTMKTANPHFFKIIMNDSILQGKLAIPKKFQRVYGDNLSKEVLLRVPSGDEWKIQLVEQDEDLWLQGGWVEFAEFYSLAHGYLIVFKFEGDGNFQILIFDQTASEIDYPCLTNHDQGQNSDINSESDVEQLTTALEIDYPCLSNHDQGQDSDINSESDVEQLTSAEFFAKNSDKTEQVKRLRETSPSESRRSNKRLKINAASRNGETQSQADNANNFVKKITNGNMKYAIWMPADFSRKTGLQSKETVTLKYVTEGGGVGAEKWDVGIQRDTDHRCSRVGLRAGWTKFYTANRLSLGDTCSFEFVHGCLHVKVSRERKCYGHLDCDERLNQLSYY